jgi:NAD(P)-dependent dehydrogenase (short-subunit alcohol dehydrogenase family)
MLKDKVIVVTGSEGLLGRAIVQELKKNSAKVISLDVAFNGLESEDKIFCDITSEESVLNVISLIKSNYDKIDGWVNNAYPRNSFWGKKIEDLPVSAWRENVDNHLNGYFICCKHILALMKIQGTGSLINLASIYGFLGPDFSIYEGTDIVNPVGYSAIKGGILNLSRYLASYYGPYNVRVNCVSPGGIFDNQDPIFVEKYTNKTPMKRMGNPDDIAPVIKFLLSEDSKYITGQNIVVDGGWSIV